MEQDFKHRFDAGKDKRVIQYNSQYFPSNDNAYSGGEIVKTIFSKADFLNEYGTWRPGSCIIVGILYEKDVGEYHSPHIDQEVSL